MKQFRPDVGYSIIELLTVIITISILASLTVTSYVYYIQETKKTSISNSVNVYQNAVNQVVVEKNASPSQQLGDTTGGCLSSSTATCCLARGTTVPFCRKNTDADGIGGFSNAASVYSMVSPYVKSPFPTLPELSRTMPLCGASAAGPCYTQQIGYIATTSNSSSPKGALSYYLPDTSDCESNDVMVFDTSTSPNRYKYGPTGQKYTSRVATQYTECVIGIR